MLRLQLELSQAKGDLERRLQEKEEEMEAARYLSFLSVLHLPHPQDVSSATTSLSAATQTIYSYTDLCIDPLT